MEADLVLAQEPSVLDADRWPSLEQYTLVAGSRRMGTWVREGFRPPSCSSPEDFVQRLDLGYAAVFNVYLDAYARDVRAEQMERLQALMRMERDRPVVILGDFNLAPTPEDGMVGVRESTFNSTVDREPFGMLLTAAHLVDTLASQSPREFTVERVLKGSQVRFRCDLALVSRSWVREVKCSYDHSVRSGEAAFTDHSAIIVDTPLALSESASAHQERQLHLLLDGGEDSQRVAPDYHSHRTAMNRGSESPVARFTATVLRGALGIETLLDYGCGRGQDVRYYRAQGIQADGFDPYPPFGWSSEPSSLYDLVTLVFVLNVIADPASRVRAIESAAARVKESGFLLIAARSPADIEPRARKGRWPLHNDGYWSDRRRGMFQKGISEAEMQQLAALADFEPMRTPGLSGLGAATTCGLFCRRGP